MPSGLTTRVLPPEEWPRLAGTEAETVWPHLNPAGAQVVVVESEGVIVGCWVLMQVAHVECLWIHPERRGTASVARRLMRGISDLARAWGAERVWTVATAPEIRGLLTHVGAQSVPGDHFVMPVWRV